MKTSDFDYPLPENLIASYPLPGRDASRLLRLDRYSGNIAHLGFRDLPALLVEGDLLVLNDTKVIPARLMGKSRGYGRFEVLLLEKLSPTLWKSMMRNPKHGAAVEFQSGMRGRIIKNGREGWLFEFERAAEEYIEQFGSMPLPPYIRRDAEEADRQNYQTVYARQDGSAAAPTAGLHFTENLLGRIRQKGVDLCFVTLHVGAGTFQPVKSEEIEKHKMHSEWREIGADAAAAINSAKRDGRRVIAVGTTAVRTIESAAAGEGEIQPALGYTDIFITPGFNFRIVDGMITNFHTPRSTLLMLVSAFAGRERILRAYDAAVGEGYRFLSYGDAMIIL
ncbi:MAG: tRNA preQ1(34) S-adenosylmethionine ribosyltransferase-isomerase QueA [Deltaproteobacteria bacterium]